MSVLGIVMSTKRWRSGMHLAGVCLSVRSIQVDHVILTTHISTRKGYQWAIRAIHPPLQMSKLTPGKVKKQNISLEGRNAMSKM